MRGWQLPSTASWMRETPVELSCALTIAWLETPLRRASGLVAPRFNGARGFFICPRIQIGRLGSEAMAAEAEVMSERALPLFLHQLHRSDDFAPDRTPSSNISNAKPLHTSALGPTS